MVTEKLWVPQHGKPLRLLTPSAITNPHNTHQALKHLWFAPLSWQVLLYIYNLWQWFTYTYIIFYRYLKLKPCRSGKLLTCSCHKYNALTASSINSLMSSLGTHCFGENDLHYHTHQSAALHKCHKKNSPYPDTIDIWNTQSFNLSLLNKKNMTWKLHTTISVKCWSWVLGSYWGPSSRKHVFIPQQQQADVFAP